jgi:hypothetical protein
MPRLADRKSVGAARALGEKQQHGCSRRGHNMTTPVTITTSYISDDESDANYAACPQCEQHGWIGTYCSRCEDQGMTYSVPIAVRRAGKQRYEPRASWGARMVARLRNLTRVGKAGSELPQVGQVCLVLHGIEGRDLGQQAVVTSHTRARVRIAYRDQDGRQVEKLKHPNALVLLEDGLGMAQDERGFVWVKREADPRL